MEFTRDQIPPEQLPLIESRIRQAQDGALHNLGLRFPTLVVAREKKVDAANRQHREFLRSGLAAPRLTSAKAMGTYFKATIWFGSLFLVLGTPTLYVFTGGYLNGARWNPWIVTGVLAAITLLVLLPAFISTYQRRGEMPWALLPQFSTSQITIAKTRLKNSLWAVVPTGILLVVSFLLYYNTTEFHEEYPYAVITVLGVPVLYILIALSLWLRAREDWKQARRSVTASGLDDLHEDRELRDRIAGHSRSHAAFLKWRTIDFSAAAERALEDATVDVVAELVLEGTLTPELGGRLLNGGWTMARLLTTTPEFAPDSPRAAFSNRLNPYVLPPIGEPK